MIPVKVCKKRCEQCLYTEGRIVSGERARSIRQQLRAEDNHFICHKSQVNGGGDRICRGSYEENPRIIRLAKAMKIPVVFVDPQTGEAS